MLVKGVLTPEHEAAGLTLEEVGDDLLLLKQGDHVFAAFAQCGATPEVLRWYADRRLESGRLTRGGGAIGDRRGMAGDAVPAPGAPAEAAGAGEARPGGPGKNVEDPRREP